MVHTLRSLPARAGALLPLGQLGQRDAVEVSGELPHPHPRVVDPEDLGQLGYRPGHLLPAGDHADQSEAEQTEQAEESQEQSAGSPPDVVRSPQIWPPAPKWLDSGRCPSVD